jgi:hypothetical protein
MTPRLWISGVSIRALSIRARAALGAVAVAASVTVAVPTSTAHAAPEDLGCGESLLEKTLENGAAWRMCARIHPVKGLVVEKIEFKPATGKREYEGFKRVLDQVYLAQLNVPYDLGHEQFNDITSYGFGGSYLMPQGPKVCHGEAIDVNQATTSDDQLIERTLPGICTDEVPTGLSSHSQEKQDASGPLYAQHGTSLEVSSVSKISWYEYQQKVTFDDHGGIDVGLGATGDLANYYSTEAATGWPTGPPIDVQDYYGTSHWHNAIYRVDFGIDSGTDQRVEQWDYTSPGKDVAPIVHGAGTEKTTAFSAVPGDGNDELSWWRVLNPQSLNEDGHARSYEIVNRNPTDSFIPVTQPLVSFTNANACQEYASDNLNPECPNQSILDYVAGDDAPLTDPVAWVNVGFHHIDRDEDQSPMPVHWQRFQIVPRDFFAQSPAITEERGCINGPQYYEIDSTNRPCVARNYYRPRITAASTPVGPGTVLTASKGVWIENRTTWNYAYLWFRDGEPIIGTHDNGDPEPAVGPVYTVTEADAGHQITVKVTASQTGYGSGTAESLATTVPGGATPTPAPTTPIPTVDTPTSPSPLPALAASTSTGRLVKPKVTVRQNAKLKVSVAVRGASASGRFHIRNGSKVLKTGYLRNGTATITLPKLKKARTYRLRVVFLGSSTVKPSTSRPVTLRVTKR